MRDEIEDKLNRPNVCLANKEVEEYGIDCFVWLLFVLGVIVVITSIIYSVFVVIGYLFSN